MDFYIVALRKSSKYWVAMCLENGLIGQGNTKENAVEKRKESIFCMPDFFIRKTIFKFKHVLRIIFPIYYKLGVWQSSG